VPLGMTPVQLVIAVTMLSVYFPCVATFVVLLRELGARGLAAAVGVMVTTALLVGGALRAVLIGF
jgi:ferrous iron transport protein B